MPLKKLTPQEVHENNTNELIAQIEKKDRRFRFFQTLFMVMTMVALVLVISAQQRTLDGVRDQLVEQKRIAEVADKNSKDQLATILRRFDCLVVYFGQKNRSTLTIENIDKCTLNRDGNIQEFFTTSPDGDTPTNETQQNLPQAPNQ